MEQLQERPAYVVFETRSVEDREATIKQGVYVGKDVDYALITPPGSKDRIERIVGEWLPQKKEDVQAGRLPDAWYRSYVAAYEDFKAGKESPIDGIPVIDWPGLSPSQVKTLLSLNLRSVQDVATMNEESIARLGMGGRSLKQRAIEYLAAAERNGKPAEELAALRQKLSESEAREKLLNEKMDQLGAQIKALMPANQQAAAQSESISASDFLDDDGPGQPL